MSVLKSKRTESKAEYVNVANAIYIETINFLTRISARYSRLIAEPVAKLAGEVIDHAEKANSIYPSDDQRRQLRKAHLLEARASLMALDVRLTHCYLIMTQNPQGCFTTPSGKSVDAKKATERLDKMAQKLKTIFYSQKSTNPSSPGDTRLPVDWDIVLYIPSMLIFPGICHFKMNKNPLYFSLTCIRQKAKGFPRMRIFSTTTVIPSPAGGWCGLFRRIKKWF